MTNMGFWRNIRCPIKLFSNIFNQFKAPLVLENKPYNRLGLWKSLGPLYPLTSAKSPRLSYFLIEAVYTYKSVFLCLINLGLGHNWKGQSNLPPARLSIAWFTGAHWKVLHCRDPSIAHKSDQTLNKFWKNFKVSTNFEKETLTNINDFKQISTNFNKSWK